MTNPASAHIMVSHLRMIMNLAHDLASNARGTAAGRRMRCVRRDAVTYTVGCAAAAVQRPPPHAHVPTMPCARQHRQMRDGAVEGLCACAAMQIERGSVAVRTMGLAGGDTCMYDGPMYGSSVPLRRCALQYT